MKKILFLFVFYSLIMSSCSSSKKIVHNSSKVKPSKADKIVANAVDFKGVKYKYGGTTKKGVDCSGIIFSAYKKEKIAIPRVSTQMAKKGIKISLNRAKKGDLLFFGTAKNSRKINHVGLVVSAKKGLVKFTHATSSKGVIISSLVERYWKNAFVKSVKML